MAGNLGLPATAYVVLGLVSIRPVTGYELVGYAERTVGNFFPMTRSHIYSELRRLGFLGLLDGTEIEQDNAPTKRVYEITAEGREELGYWLEEEGMSEARTRSMFLVRIFFGDRTSPDRMAALLDKFEARARARRDALAAVVDRLADRPQSVFRRATAMLGLRREEANLDWVAQIRSTLLATYNAAAALGREG